MRVRFWGTRGSIATPGPGTNRFGGNTSCVEVVTNSGRRFILDCGTGARLLGMDMMARAPKPIRATILLGHTHWDHIQGFPFFAPLFIPQNEFTICAPTGVGQSLASVLSGQMEFTYFPVALDQLPAAIEYKDLTEGTYEFDGVRVVTQFLNHPATSLGYRIEADGAVLVYACDHEPFATTLWREGAQPGVIESIVHTGDRRHALFMRHADLLIHDAQYLPQEYAAKKNWGHSTYEYVVELAAAADVRQLALTHHDPTHDDVFLDSLEASAQKLARQRNFGLQVLCAYEGSEFEVRAPETARSRSLEVAGAGGISPDRLCILVVDDDPNLRMLVDSTLRHDGYTVLEAEDGEQGLERVRADRPDLILLDVNMPKMDGLAVLQQLRSKVETRNIPVLMLTAQAGGATTQAAFDAGATDYLAKPFTVPQLTTRVRACLDRWRGTPAAKPGPFM
jgi:CheY-like chemotaxis protein/phosphoribosyl 1,2-cyclic phosphodiesterase